MAWHIGPQRERFTRAIGDNLVVDWHKFLAAEVADSQSRWRLDSYLENVNRPIDIADTFLGEWLEGLWRVPTK